MLKTIHLAWMLTFKCDQTRVFSLNCSLQRMATRLLSFDVGTKNLSFCDLSVDSSMSFEVHAWTVASTVPRGINVNKTPLWDLAPPFYKYVRSNVTSWLWNADGSPKPMDRVLIENQPMGGRGAARNLKTKVLSHILQCAILESRPDLNVSFVHPGLKLKDMPKPLEGGKTTYRENKMYAIQKTAEYIQTDLCKNKDACKELYLDKKMKKDDLADAFLQGLFVAHIVARGDLVEAKNTLEETAKAPVVVKKRASKKAASESVKTVPSEPATTEPATTVPSEPATTEPVAVPVDTTETKKAKTSKTSKTSKKKISEVIALEATEVPTEAVKRPRKNK